MLNEAASSVMGGRGRRGSPAAARPQDFVPMYIPRTLMTAGVLEGETQRIWTIKPPLLSSLEFRLSKSSFFSCLSVHEAEQELTEVKEPLNFLVGVAASIFF